MIRIWPTTAILIYVPAMRGPSPDSAVPAAAADPSLGEGFDGVKGMFQKGFGGGLHLRQQIGIADAVGHARVGKPGLARDQELSGSAQFQVAPRDHETVVGFADHLETCARDLAQWVAV